MHFSLKPLAVLSKTYGTFHWNPWQFLLNLLALFAESYRESCLEDMVTTYGRMRTCVYTCRRERMVMSAWWTNSAIFIGFASIWVLHATHHFYHLSITTIYHLLLDVNQYINSLGDGSDGCFHKNAGRKINIGKRLEGWKRTCNFVAENTSPVFI